jgi:hypothetical protein
MGDGGREERWGCLEREGVSLLCGGGMGDRVPGVDDQRGEGEARMDLLVGERGTGTLPWLREMMAWVVFGSFVGSLWVGLVRWLTGEKKRGRVSFRGRC